MIITLTVSIRHVACFRAIRTPRVISGAFTMILSASAAADAAPLLRAALCVVYTIIVSLPRHCCCHAASPLMLLFRCRFSVDIFHATAFRYARRYIAAIERQTRYIDIFAVLLMLMFYFVPLMPESAAAAIAAIDAISLISFSPCFAIIFAMPLPYAASAATVLLIRHRVSAAA